MPPINDSLVKQFSALKILISLSAIVIPVASGFIVSVEVVGIVLFTLDSSGDENTSDNDLVVLR